MEFIYFLVFVGVVGIIGIVSTFFYDKYHSVNQ